MNDSAARGSRKPAQIDSSRNLQGHELSSLQNGRGQIVGKCHAVQSIYRLIEKVADSDSTILISGETGTGKGVVARAIHHLSYRRDRPFVSINCGAIPEHLLESELMKFLTSGLGERYNSAKNPCRSSPPLIPDVGSCGPGRFMWTISVISFWYSIAAPISTLLIKMIIWPRF